MDVEARLVEERGRGRVAEGFGVSGARYLHRASAYYHVGERATASSTTKASAQPIMWDWLEQVLQPAR